MADPSRTIQNSNDPQSVETLTPVSPVKNSLSVSSLRTPPSLIHVLESVVRSVPPPPPKPSSESEVVFLSEELKFAQKQNQSLSRKLEETIARISHLERENFALREELDSSMHCLPPIATTTTSSSSSSALPTIIDQSTSPCFREPIEPILLT